MKSFKTYTKMLGFMKPYVHLFIISVILSFIIVSMDGIAIWFLGSLPKTLFNPEAAITVRPELTLRNLNLFFKFITYRIIRSERFGNPLGVVCLLIVVTYTLKNILFYINRLLLRILNLNVIRDMRNLLYEHVLMLPVSYYDKNRSGKIVALIVNDIAQINRSMTDTLSKSIMEPLRLIFFSVMLLIINFKLTAVVFIIYPILAFLIVKIGQSVRRRSKRVLESFSGMMSVLTETIQGVRAVKMFNMNRVESEKFQQENRKFTRSSFRSEKVKALLIPLTETLAMYFIAVLLWYGGKESLAGSPHFTPEDFFRFLVFFFSAYQPLKKIGTVNNIIQVGIAAAGRVFGLLSVRHEELDTTIIKKAPTFENEIALKNVWFTYPGTRDSVLNGVTFTVKKGEVVAVVGSSGAGKTTILDLLPRFYELTRGSICIDGIDTRKIDLVSLRNLFGIVSQQTILFNETIENNIKYGSIHASTDDVNAAATAANAMEFIETLPDGMQTVIGEQGVMLSGGQRQRLSIARALLRNPDILILDEATSALDTESELLVQNAIDNLIQNRTTFVVAHRLSTIRHADKIIVLEKGEVVERGTHEELLSLNKRYKHLYDIQFDNK